MALRRVGAELGDADDRRKRRAGTGQLHDPDGDPSTRRWQFRPGEWEQTSKNLTALIGVAMMRFIGPRFLSSYYKKVYDGVAT
jgi:hypothetical protein